VSAQAAKNEQDPEPKKAADPKTDKEPEKGRYEDPPMTLWEHLAELRKRLVIAIIALGLCACVAWEYREEILGWLVLPFADAWRNEHLPGEPKLHFPTPMAAFFSYFKLSLIAGVFGAAPIIAYQLWAFIAPGLYAKEKKYIIPFVLGSTILFVGGGYFGWRTAFPVAFEYLLGLSGTLKTVGVEVVPTVMMGDYIDMVVQMLLGFGLAFELPLVLLFMSMIGMISYLHLIYYGRWFVVAIFVFAAIITPSTDIASQLTMAVPMLGLYGISIGLAYFLGKAPSESQRESFKRKREERRREREEDMKKRREQKAAARKKSDEKKD
jgi:sec-independent protein translocase protein TatC